MFTSLLASSSQDLKQREGEFLDGKGKSIHINDLFNNMNADYGDLYGWQRVLSYMTLTVIQQRRLYRTRVACLVVPLRAVWKIFIPATYSSLATSM